MTLLPALALAAQAALAPCAIDGVPGEARCGTHRVWENRETKQGRQIDLSIIVLPATTADRRPDPLFALSGGPGDAPSFNARFFSRAFADIRKHRDLVFVDLRGTGKSAPLLCPELALPGANGVFDADLLSLPAVRACRARLERTADLTQYTTEIAVDDLDEVRRALGYDAINLYGTSYGSRVAQVYMRRHPGSLRAVTMKGIVPPSMAMPESHAQAGQDAWRALVERCRQDQDCRRTFPTLDADFHALLERLDKTSPVLALPAEPNRPAQSVTVTRGLFAEAFRNRLYTPENAARMPRMVREMLGGDVTSIAETALAGRTALGGDRLAAGFFLSVTCAEDIPYLPANPRALAAGTFGGDYRLQQQTAACAEWPRGQVSSAHRQPTRSSIATLIVSGELDPVTPPSGGDEVLRGLAAGAHVVIRNNGHPIGNAEACVGSMFAAFLDKGSAAGLDRSCAEAIAEPPFQLPGPRR
ncbi:MAG: alpha/beta fold hydrolase [Vicinamibacterales bacterium]